MILSNGTTRNRAEGRDGSCVLVEIPVTISRLARTNRAAGSAKGVAGICRNLQTFTGWRRRRSHAMWTRCLSWHEWGKVVSASRFVLLLTHRCWGDVVRLPLTCRSWWVLHCFDWFDFFTENRFGSGWLLGRRLGWNWIELGWTILA